MKTYAKLLPDQDYLKEILSYNPETGEFHWKTPPGLKIKAGAVAGQVKDNGYHAITIQGKVYKSHRLAWKIQYNEDPPDHIDHVNGSKLDNRIENLRKATPSQNQYNKRMPRLPKSGVKGVCWHKAVKKWRAQIATERRVIHLGYFTEISEAADARAAAVLIYHGGFMSSPEI